MASANEELSREQLVHAQAHIWNHTFTFINSVSLKSAIQLRIPDIIHNHGKPMKLSELVDSLPIHKSKSHYIYRLMRLLVHSEFFIKVDISDSEEQEERYWLTPASRLLLQDAHLTVAPLVLLILDPILTKPWEYTSEWLSNDHLPSAFETANDGTNFWEVAGREAKVSNLFNEAMSSDTRLVARVLINDCKHVFEGIESLVDVGGNTGTFAKAILDAFPNIKCLVLDLPHNLVGLEVRKNLTFVGGDMFEVIPRGDAILLKDAHLTVAPFVLAILDPIFTKPWEYTSEWLANEHPPSPFETANGGATFWEVAGREARVSNLFNEAMSSDTRLMAHVLANECKHVFDGIESVVDVGGNTGTLAKAILDAFPNMKCIVLDLPHNLVGLEGSNNLTFVGGDMFEAIPSADVVFLKCILHDWNDEDCVRILKKCRDAISGGKVIIIDMVMNIYEGDNKAIEDELFFDMAMMVYQNGKERNEKEWAKLFSDAGFTTYKITPAFGVRSLIEVYP